MMNTLLFFDDWYLENRFNVVRQQGIPQWDQQATFEDACIEGLGNFPTVFRQDTDTWRAMYWAYTAGVRLLTAESKDGRAWRRSDVSGLGQPTNRKHRRRHRGPVLGRRPDVERQARHGLRQERKKITNDTELKSSKRWEVGREAHFLLATQPISPH